MGRRAASCLAVAALAMTALPACGNAQAPPNQTGESQPAVGSATGSRQLAVALKRIGRFEAPVYVAGAPGFPRLLFVVERAGTVRVLRGGRRLPRPFLDISGLVSSDGERGLLSIAFPPDYRRSRRFYVYYTDRSGRHQGRRVQAPQCDASRARVAAHCDRDTPPDKLEPQRRPAAVPRQPPPSGVPETAAPAATHPTTRRTATASWASCCGSTPGPREAAPTRSRPATRSWGRRGSRRGLQLRPAQPIPLLLRHGDGRGTANRDRRRRAGPLRGARLHDRRRRRGAPTSVGTRSRASPATGTRTAARPIRAER